MTRTRIFITLQLAITVALCIFIFSVVRSNSAKDVDRDTIAAAMQTEATGIDQLQNGSTQDIRRYLHIDPSTCDWVIYYKGNGIMDVSELVIVKAASSEALSEAESGIQARLSGQIISFTGYGTNQLELLEQAVCRRIGNYYFYGVSENINQWEEVFLNLVR